MMRDIHLSLVSADFGVVGEGHLVPTQPQVGQDARQRSTELGNAPCDLRPTRGWWPALTGCQPIPHRSDRPHRLLRQHGVRPQQPGGLAMRRGGGAAPPRVCQCRRRAPGHPGDAAAAPRGREPLPPAGPGDPARRLPHHVHGVLDSSVVAYWNISKE